MEVPLVRVDDLSPHVECPVVTRYLRYFGLRPYPRYVERPLRTLNYTPSYPAPLLPLTAAEQIALEKL
jgi:hypothetical protein